MNRHEIIDEIVTQISKDKNIPEHEVGAYEVTLKLADKVVNLLSLTAVSQRSEPLDLGKLNKNFDEILASFDKKKLQDWLDSKI